MQNQMMQVEKMRVDIETVSPLAAGQTVCDIYHKSLLPKNVLVARVSKTGNFQEIFEKLFWCKLASPSLKGWQGIH